MLWEQEPSRRVFPHQSASVFSLAGYFLMNNVTWRKKQSWKILRTYLKQFLHIRTVFHRYYLDRRGGGLMISALVSGSNGPGPSLGQLRRCIMFLGKPRYSHSAFLHPSI